MEGQGPQVTKVFHPGVFQISAPAQNWSTCGGNHSNFQREAGEETLQCEMWLSGLSAGPTRCCEDTSPQGFLLLGVPGSDVPALWSPSHCQQFTVNSNTALSLLVLPQKRVSVLLEVQKNLFWNIFLKKSSVPLLLGQKIFWQIPTPLTSKLERDCPSHCFKE